MARHPSVPPEYAAYIPPGGLGAQVRTSAALAVELYEKRQTADYDPGVLLHTVDATLAIANARSALRQWGAAPGDAKRLFILLLLFPPRSRAQPTAPPSTRHA